ncbi:MAG: hypothetical protein ACF8XB_14945, partial [Planctomycetota bacterium JB042]
RRDRCGRIEPGTVCPLLEARRRCRRQRSSWGFEGSAIVRDSCPPAGSVVDSGKRVGSMPSRRLVRFVRLAVLLAPLALSPACQLTPTFSTGYEVDPEVGAPSFAKSVVVVPLNDEREPRDYDQTGRIFLTYVPFIPWVTLRFERLEESVKIQSDSIAQHGSGMTLVADQNVAPPFEQYTYPSSFARAIAADLKASKVFERVDFAERASPGDHDYVLSGTIRGTELRAAWSSYCLGMVGVLLWMLPLPISKTTAEVDVRLSLSDVTTGEIVWEDDLSAEVRRTIMLYTSSAMIYGRGGAFSFNLIPPPSDSRVDSRSLFSWHFEALRRAMIPAKESLRAALTARG